MMAKKNTSNEAWDDIQGKDKGYVYSVDYIGPYSPDVDGNISRYDNQIADWKHRKSIFFLLAHLVCLIELFHMSY